MLNHWTYSRDDEPSAAERRGTPLVGAHWAGIAHRHSVQRLHPVVPAVLGQQYPFALARWRDDLAGEPEHGGLVGGAMAYHQRPAAFG